MGIFWVSKNCDFKQAFYFFGLKSKRRVSCFIAKLNTIPIARNIKLATRMTVFHFAICAVMMKYPQTKKQATDIQHNNE